MKACGKYCGSADTNYFGCGCMVVVAVVAAVVVAACDGFNLTCVFVAQGPVAKEDLSP